MKARARPPNGPSLVWMMIWCLGCAQPPSVALPTTGFDTCAGHGLAAVIRGEPTDARVAWLESLLDGSRIEVVWPEGFRARFSPELEILDESGVAVLQGGDYVDGSCGTVGGRELLAPPFLALELDCGPLPVFQCQLAVRRVATSNGWPIKDVASIVFLTAAGEYLVTYEDGATVSGH
jgi:hypothetical protein